MHRSKQINRYNFVAKYLSFFGFFSTTQVASRQLVGRCLSRLDAAISNAQAACWTTLERRLDQRQCTDVLAVAPLQLWFLRVWASHRTGHLQVGWLANLRGGLLFLT